MIKKSSDLLLILIPAVTVRLSFLALLALPGITMAQTLGEPDSLMQILVQELKREIDGLSIQEYPPYYLEYRVDQTEQLSLSASFGSLTDSSHTKSRILSTSVRLGDYQLDNTHQLKGDAGFRRLNQYSYGVPISLDNEPLAIQQTMWMITDKAYKKALSDYLNLLNQLEMRENSGQSAPPDFSPAPPQQFYESKAPFPAIDQAGWIKTLKHISALFAQSDDYLSGEASLRYEQQRKYFISTEGTQLIHNHRYASIMIQASIRSKDGNLLPLHQSFYALTPAGLPDEKTLAQEVRKMISQLQALKQAPVAEPYTGPALLSPEAAGVFFHEIFGHRIEGHRLKDEDDGQTFKSKLDKPILPSFIQISSDPTRKMHYDQHLIGAYAYDDQGIKSQPVEIVNDGILKNFLMSRNPIPGFDQSNGHGRAAAGLTPVSRQSNLIIKSSKPSSEQALRKKLIKACKKQKKTYGYYFKEVVGGFTLTNRYTPNVFNIMPTVVYRVYVDGRPDELVRGVDLIGTPLAMFAEIAATGNESGIFTGFCGAESGSIPVTTISPALFVEKVETQRKPESHVEAPVIESPKPKTIE
ncbi:MAG: TldD/PmbA family protein [Candidatus Cyclobacteriaceae bacterium M3_2C_046]